MLEFKGVAIVVAAWLYVLHTTDLYFRSVKVFSTTHSVGPVENWWRCIQRTTLVPKYCLELVMLAALDCKTLTYSCSVS